jgi:tetratricopeptide (TPR) repeat protein
MKKCILLLLVFCPFGMLFSQSSKIDSLHRKLKVARQDTSVLNLLMEIGNYYQTSDPDTAIYFHTQARLLSEKLKDELKTGEAIRQYGWDNYVTGNLDIALASFDKAIGIAEKYIHEASLRYKARKLLAAGLSNKGSYYLSLTGYQKSLAYFLRALEISKENGTKDKEASVLGNIGIVYLEQADYEKALEYEKQALHINEQLGLKNNSAHNMAHIGLIYSDQSNYPLALEYYLKALKVYEENGNKMGLGMTLSSIGAIYVGQDNAKALEYYLKALKVNKNINSKQNIAIDYTNIGSIYSDMGDDAKALEYYLSALKLNEEIGNENGQAINYGTLGLVYMNRKDYKNALKYFSESFKIHERTNFQTGVIDQGANIGNLYLKQAKYAEAEKYLTDAYRLAGELGALNQIKTLHLYLSNLYEKTGRSPLALKHYKAFINLRDSIYSEENARKSIQQEYAFNYAKKSAADSIANVKASQIKNAELARQKAELKAKRNQQYALYGGLVLVLVFAGFMFNRFKITQKQKNIIELKEKETHQQKQIIEQKHKEITDSINYAERIQRTFLATKELLDENLASANSATAGYFIFYKPKDVVSGDFYWAKKLSADCFAFAVADSTGHGVPGAIMSLLNITSLEQAAEHTANPAEMLNHARKTITERLMKDGSSDGGKDGMDCSMLVFDRKEKERLKLHIASANNPVWIVRGSFDSAQLPELIEVQPDKMPVGKSHKETGSFTPHTIELKQGDVIFALTDGFPDQFGGKTGKKFMSRNLKKLLMDNSGLPFHQQKEILEATFSAWKGDLEQIDDVCVVGIRV